MTAEMTLRLRQSEVREAINSLLGLEERTDENRSELRTLTATAQGLETEIRAAIVAAPDPDPVTLNDGPEARERLELRGKARVSDFVTAALTGRGVLGASAEYADSVGCTGLMPLELLESRAITPGPASESVTATRPTVPPAFARTDAAALGISFPVVSPGEAHFPVLTTSPPAGPKAKDAAADSTAGAFTLAKRTPRRITGQFLVRVEDIALMASLEDDLRNAISANLAQSLDSQVIGGSGNAPNLDGLFSQATSVSVAGSTETFASAIIRLAGLVDGINANGFEDIKALIGVQTFAKYNAIFANADKGDISAYDHLKAKLGGLRVSTRAPAKASNGQKAIAVLGAQGQFISVPIWRGVEIIVDPFSKADLGQRIVTAVSLVGSPFIPHGVKQAVIFHPKIS